MTPNPNRPTATWKLWASGVSGGLLVALYLFLTGTVTSESSTSLNRGLGQIAFGAFFLAAAAAGGWQASRRGRGR